MIESLNIASKLLQRIQKKKVFYFSLSKKNLDVLLLVTGIFAFLRLPGSTDSCEDPPK